MPSYLRAYIQDIDESIREHEVQVDGLESLRSHMLLECEHEETYTINNDGILETYCGVCEKLLHYDDSNYLDILDL